MFIDKLIAEDDYYKPKKEILKHFNNWLRVELTNATKKETKKDFLNGLTASDFDENGNLI